MATRMKEEGVAGSSMQIEQHRTPAVPRSQKDGLTDSSENDPHTAIESRWPGNRRQPRDAPARTFTREEGRTHEREGDQSDDDGQHGGIRAAQRTGRSAAPRALTASARAPEADAR